MKVKNQKKNTKKTLTFFFIFLLLISIFFNLFYIETTKALTEGIENGGFESGDFTAWTDITRMDVAGYDIDYPVLESGGSFLSQIHNISDVPNQSYITQILSTPLDASTITEFSMYFIGNYSASADPTLICTIYYNDSTQADTSPYYTLAENNGVWVKVDFTDQLNTSKTVTSIFIKIYNYGPVGYELKPAIDDIVLSWGEPESLITLLQLPFDNETSTIAYDWSDSANDGIITGASRSYDGKYGMALSFDGTDYVTVIDDSSLDLETLFLSIRIKVSSITESVLIDKPNAYGLYLRSNGGLSFMINGEFFNTTSTTLSINTWYHITASYDTSTESIALNGISVYSDTAYTSAMVPSAFDLIIGDQYVGIIDEVLVANQTFTNYDGAIATYPYVYNGYVDTTECSWTVTTLTYNFTSVYVRQDSTYPITYAKFNFTDGVNELGLSYTVSSSAFDIIGDEESVAKISLASRSATISNNALILQARFRIEEIIQSLVDVDIYFYCETADSSDSLLIEDRFSIYGIGGVTTTTIVGDGVRTAGGSIFDIMAQNSSLTGAGSSIRVDTIVPNFQHLHTLTHLYQNAFWDTDHWDCPTDDANTGYLEYGVDYLVENKTGGNHSWVTGWKVRINVVDGAAGTFGLSNDASWVRLNVTWWNADTFVKADDVYVFYEAYRNENDTTTQFSLFIDLWISSDEFSSNVAGHVSSQYYGMEETGWWLWANWGPVGSLSTSSSFSDNLYDGDGNITSASTLKMFRVWSKIAKTDPGVGCDEHLWASINEVTQMQSISPSLELTGIITPMFQPTTTPDMPLGFFASLGNILTGALSLLWQAIMALANAAYTLTASVLDSVFGLFGITDFTASITSFLSGIAIFFTTSLSYVTLLIVTFLTFFASAAMFLITWFGGFVNAIITIGTGIADVFSGKSVPLGDLQLGVLGQFWTVVAELVATSAIFIFLAIYWFASIDSRAKQTGGGWMSILMSDIQSMISIFSFILDMSWRVVSTVIDFVMRFINVFL